MTLRVFEFTKPGFDGGTDRTDDQVVWVAAQAVSEVQQALPGHHGCTVLDIDLPAAPGIGIDYWLPDDATKLLSDVEAIISDSQDFQPGPAVL